jgi:uncharacterized membrane protein
MAKKNVRVLNKNEMSEKDERRLFAFLAVLLSIIGFLIALLVKRDDKYVMYYAKQSLVLFFAFIIINAVGFVLNMIPIIGNLIYGILTVFLVVFWVLGMIYALSDKQKEIPFIGHYVEYFDF